MAARRHENPAAETLEEIESLGDRLAEWIGRNAAVVLGGAIVVLLAAAVAGGVLQWQGRSRDAASAELARVTQEYRDAMGSPADSWVLVEPANAEAARTTRRDFLPRFQALAQAQRGNPAGALAALQAGTLQEELGDRAAAIETWEAAASAMAPDEVSRALLLERIAGAHEIEGRFVQAAERYEAAFAVESFPLRYAALANAARCYAEAGMADAALAAFDRFESGAEGAVRMSDALRFRLLELRAAQQRAG